jgi:hypothetical protein
MENIQHKASQTNDCGKQLYTGNTNDLKIKIWALDLNAVIFKLLNPDEGEGWTEAQALTAEEEYRKFLYLTVTSEQAIVPTMFVDKFWHAHILDTKKYQDDCSHLFGFFLHHFPYFGLRGDEDKSNLQKAFKAAADIYETAFGSSYYVGLNGASCGTCGSCACGTCAGSGIENSVVMSNIRPTFILSG